MQAGGGEVTSSERGRGADAMWTSKDSGGGSGQRGCERAEARGLRDEKGQREGAEKDEEESQGRCLCGCHQSTKHVLFVPVASPPLPVAIAVGECAGWESQACRRGASPPGVKHSAE